MAKNPNNIAPINWVKIDDTGRIEVRDRNEIVVVCDAAGERVGVFLPDSVSEEFLRVVRTCPTTWDEWERRGEQTGGRSLSEILKSLGQTA